MPGRIVQHCLIYFSGILIATVRGGIRDCGDVDYPGLFVNLLDPSVWNFVMETTSMKEFEPIDTFKV